MNMHFIGQCSLNTATILYLIWFIPQLGLSAAKQSVQGLSLTTHCILVVGYCADLVYGFGLHMPWQYRLVTLSGLVYLCIQHTQFYFYKKTSALKSFLLIFFILLFGALLLTTKSFNLFGYLSMLSGWLYAWPQIFKNHTSDEVSDLSLVFVSLSVVMGALDTISAYTLHWNLPSRIGSPISLMQGLVLFYQLKSTKRPFRARKCF